MATNEEIIVEIMKEANCYGRDNMITPSQLIEKCIIKGLIDPNQMQSAIVSLVDQDVIDYEMDENLQTSELWLL